MVSFIYLFFGGGAPRDLFKARREPFYGGLEVRDFFSSGSFLLPLFLSHLIWILRQMRLKHEQRDIYGVCVGGRKAGGS